jgi:protection-of-telomeres protein 1
VQKNMGFISLITSKTPITEIHILKASDIPRDMSNSTHLPWKSTSPFPKNSYNLPSSAEMIYAIWAFGKADEMYLPTDQEFQERTIRAMNMKDKFSLLKDVRAGQSNQYYDLIGQVVKVFETSQGYVDIQFSDYTSNSQFYEHVCEEHTADYKNCDPYVYGNKVPDRPDSHAWQGPYGKFTITITLFDENAVRATTMEVNEWYLLRNVKICKRESGTLEGKMHGDGGKVLVEALDTTKGSAQIDPRLLEAIKRKRDYWQTFDKKKLQKPHQVAGKKRNSTENGSPVLNAKGRRKRARAAGEKKAAEKDSKANQALGLNEHGK